MRTRPRRPATSRSRSRASRPSATTTMSMLLLLSGASALVAGPAGGRRTSRSPRTPARLMKACPLYHHRRAAAATSTTSSSCRRGSSRPLPSFRRGPTATWRRGRASPFLWPVGRSCFFFTLARARVARVALQSQWIYGPCSAKVVQQRALEGSDGARTHAAASSRVPASHPHELDSRRSRSTSRTTSRSSRE